MWRRISRPARFLAGILLVLACLKICYSAALTYPVGVDAGLYTNFAENIRDGRGIKTNVSLFNRGFRYFPHVDTIYPLWPLVYGLSARVVPIHTVAVWLPTLLYFASLLLGYAWANRLFPGDLYPERLAGFRAGHVLVLVLGLHSIFFGYTSKPFTEGLAFALLFALMWRAQSMFRSRSVPAAIELGIWAGLLFLVRSQFLIVIAAAVIACAFGTYAYVGERRRTLIFGITALLVTGAIVAPYFFYLHEEGGVASLHQYVLFGETDAETDTPLSSSQPYARNITLLAIVASVLRGLARGFNPTNPLSYRESYHAFFVVIPLVVLAGLVECRSWWRSGSIRRAWDMLRARENAAWLFSFGVALAGFLVLHLLEKRGGNWYFHQRHNLTALPLFLFAFVAAVRSHRRYVRTIATTLFIATVILGSISVTQLVREVMVDPPRPPFPNLVQWINAERAKRGHLTLAARRAQQLVWQTPGVNYHWTNARTTLDDIRIMCDELGTDYVLVYAPVQRWLSFNKPTHEFARLFERVNGLKLDKWEVYRRRRSGPRKRLSLEKGLSLDSNIALAAEAK